MTDDELRDAVKRWEKGCRSPDPQGCCGACWDIAELAMEVLRLRGEIEEIVMVIP